VEGYLTQYLILQNNGYRYTTLYTVCLSVCLMSVLMSYPITIVPLQIRYIKVKR